MTSYIWNEYVDFHDTVEITPISELWAWKTPVVLSGELYLKIYDNEQTKVMDRLGRLLHCAVMPVQNITDITKGEYFKLIINKETFTVLVNIGLRSADDVEFIITLKLGE